MLTQRDIAKALKLSQATVSLALKNNPRISEAIREQVKAYAKENGYHADPALSALAAYRTGKRAPGYKGTVAWLTNFAKRDGWRVDAFTDYFEGASETLTEQGYRLDVFWMREPGMTERRMRDILESRSIECLLLCPQEFADTRLDWNLSDFAVVTFGYSLVTPRFHTVTAQGFSSMRTLYEQLRKQGHRRIGFTYYPEVEHRAQGAWLGGYYVARDMHNDPNIPTLPLKVTDEAVLRNWILEHKIDALVSTHATTLESVKKLELAGHQRPETYLTVSVPNSIYGGMAFDNRQIGRIAARKVVSLYHAREYGVPKLNEFTAIEGRFRAGGDE